ncbi:hypothetical protein GCM10027054_36660 [Isoptericola nanjingensis]
MGNGRVSGYYPGYKPHGAGGTVKYCTWKYRLKDSDKSADYYISEITSTWSKTQNASSGFSGRSGGWAQRVASTQAARSNVYSATPTFSRSRTGCGTAFSVGYSFAGFSISLPQKIGCSTTVKRTSLSTTAARWAHGDAAIIKKTDLSYSQKVTNGKVPKYTFSTSRPGYTYSWTKVKQTAHGSTYTGYKPKATRTSLSWTSTR